MITVALIFLFLCVAAAWLAIYGAHSTSENGWEILNCQQQCIEYDIDVLRARIGILEDRIERKEEAKP